MIIIGITGSIGMGKSTIASMLKFLRIPIHDADKVVSSLLEKDLMIKKNIKKIWPQCIIIKNDKEIVNKEELSKIIFSSEKDKLKLEQIIHPYVLLRRNKFIEKNKSNKATIIGLDVPLLYETKTNNVCSFIFLALTSEKEQKKRVLKRPNMTEKKLKEIMNNQLTNAEKKSKNPIIILTSYGKIITFMQVILYIILIITKIRKKVK